MIKYFEKIQELTIGDVVVGAHMVYGRMPTILHVDKKKTDPQEVVRILQAVKDGNADLSTDDLTTLKQYMNNSMVGASKILHFVAPQQYPIWDSKIFRFTYRKKPNPNRVNNAVTYLKYREKLRALELAMFLNQEA
jgi:putative heme iron utilization protein